MTTFAEFEKELKAHDWTAAMSDDPRVLANFYAQQRKIDEMAGELVAVDPERVERLYNDSAKQAWEGQWIHRPAKYWFDLTREKREYRKYIDEVQGLLRKTAQSLGKIKSVNAHDNRGLWTFTVEVETAQETITLTIRDMFDGVSVGVGRAYESLRNHRLLPASLTIDQLADALQKRVKDWQRIKGAKPYWASQSKGVAMNRIAVVQELVKIAKLLTADTVKVGDSVKYSTKFLRSTGQYTELGRLKGEVKKLENLGGLTLALVDWDGAAPQRVNVKNLIPLLQSHLEPT
jgi:hypothetical protein